MEEKINKKNKNTLDVIKEVAELYGFEVTECEKGKGGFYDGDEKIEFSLEDMFEDLIVEATSKELKKFNKE